jgi:hypothetical protein
MEGKCQSCDSYEEVDFSSFCPDCAAQLERDMIRTRQWKYSVRAWLLNDKQREVLRREIIAQYGEETELIEA